MHPDKTYTRSIVKIFRMISKNIREVKKAQKKNIQPHKRERERERERTKSLHDLALELCPENFTIKYE